MVVTSDHGENLGEGGIYAETHNRRATCRIPLIAIRCRENAEVDDFATTPIIPTVRELLLKPCPARLVRRDKPAARAARRPFSAQPRPCHIDPVRINPCAPRGLATIYIRTLHGGYHLLDREQLTIYPKARTSSATLHPSAGLRRRRAVYTGLVDDNLQSRHIRRPLQTVLHEAGRFTAEARCPDIKRLRDADATPTPVRLRAIRTDELHESQIIYN